MCAGGVASNLHSERSRLPEGDELNTEEVVLGPADEPERDVPVILAGEDEEPELEALKRHGVPELQKLPIEEP